MDHLDWLRERPFTLVLSGGFFGFYAHTGVLLALEEAGVRPERVVGCSAGALAGGLWASGVRAQTLEAELVRLRREDFWDPGLPWGGLLKGGKFAQVLTRVLSPTGVSRIEQCPVPFTAITHELWGFKTRALRQGSLEAAIRASCCVPLLFRPVRFEGRLLVDGGVSDRSGLSAVGAEERVLYHHLLDLGNTEAEDVPPSEGTRRTLVIPHLPAVNPFQLDLGRDALEHAKGEALRWLLEACPVGGGV